MAVILDNTNVVFSKASASKQKSKAATVRYLQQNMNFDGDSIEEACSWIGDNNLRLDLMVFEMEMKDFSDIQSQTGLLIEPPLKDKNLYRVIYTIDVYGSDNVKAAEEAWGMMRGKDAYDPVLTLIDFNGNQTTLDLFDVLEFSKITPGFVVQRYRKGSDGKFQCLWQEFIDGDDVQYENSKGQTVKPPNYDYQEFNMTLLSEGKIVYIIREVLKTLNVGGEQSRQFAEEIKILDTLLKKLIRE